VTRSPALRTGAAAILALGAGLVAALIQCSDDEGMDGSGWSRGLLVLFGASIITTVLAHRWWLLWIALVLVLPWISLVLCVVDDPTSDGMEFLYIPIEATVTAALALTGFVVSRIAARNAGTPSASSSSISR
jgi:hypothetical protein